MNIAIASIMFVSAIIIFAGTIALCIDEYKQSRTRNHGRNGFPPWMNILK